jgi:dihydroorotate dehydrogenase (NAD+) catalytic subunit
MLYDINKSYQDNVNQGPLFKGPLPKRIWPKKDLWVDFLGHKVASRLGVPAGPLLTSAWTTLAGQLGFDIVTYKTIRSKPDEGHPLPNILYVKTKPQLDFEDEILVSTPDEPALQKLAITNSFGMPSQDMAFLEKDIPKARTSLHEGQILVVSIVSSGDAEHFTDDFVNTALLAKNASAQVVEANFSCPNVKSGGQLYTNPQNVYETASRLVQALQGVPLIIKVGLFPNEELLREVLISASKAGVSAISGINTISRRVVDSSGQPALGSERLRSGICGAPIRSMAVNFIRTARHVIDKEKLPLTLIGVGGIVEADDFDAFFNAGADFAQSATGMMWDPFLATKYHERGQHATK